MPLANNKGEALIDAKYKEQVGAHNWALNKSHGNLYALSRTGGSLHSLIADIISMDRDIVDHIDRNGLDCRVANLRPATSMQNARNRKCQYSSISGFKGVGWRKDRGWYSASITIDGKRIWLGHFYDVKDAALAYNTAAIKYFGDRALLNIIE